MATLLLDWPAMLNENAALRLEINGRVLRNEENGAAISISRHEYRVRKRHIAVVTDAGINLPSSNDPQ
jgi:hypothetical protein